MKYSKSFIAALASVSTTSADRATTIGGEPCPDVHGSANFVAEQYIDRWYNLANTPFPFMNTKNRCPWANYTLESDGSVKVVKYRDCENM